MKQAISLLTMKNKILFICLIMSVSISMMNSLHAQNLSAQFIESNIKTESGTTANAFIKLKNKSSSVASFNLIKLENSKSFNFSNRYINNYEIPANDSLLIPIRVIIPSQIPGNTPLTVTAVIRTTQNNKSEEIQLSANIEVIETINVRAQVPISNVFYYIEENRIEINVEISNKGNSTRTLLFNFRTPNNIILENPIKSIRLGNRKDTIVNFQFYILKSNQLALNDYISFRLSDSVSNKQYTFIPIALREISSIKRFSEPSVQRKQDNRLDLSYYSNSQIQPYLLLTGGGYYNGNQYRLDYNFQMYYSDQVFGNQNNYTLRNARLNYESDKFSISLGDQFANVEKSVIGKGGSFKTKVSQNISIGGGYSKNQLYRFFLNAPEQDIDNYFTNLTFQFNKKSAVSLYYTRTNDGFMGVNSDLAYIELDAKNNPLQQFKFGVGYSFEKYSKGGNFTKDGYAGRLEYRFNNGKIQFMSQNYYSTNNYNGSDRGIANITQDLLFNIARGLNIGAEYQFRKMNPERYFVGVLQANYDYSNHLAGFQIQYRKTGLALSIKPVITKDRVIDPLILPSNIAVYRSEGKRLIFNNLISRGKHNITIRADVGYINSEQGIDNTFTSQYSVGYNYGRLGFNLIVNQGPYYVQEQISFLSRRSYRESFFVTPNFGFSLLNKRLDLSFSGLYRIDNQLSSDFYSLTASPSIVFNRFRLNFSANYNKIFNFTNINYRVGLERNFAKPPRPQHNLELNFYEDKNQNGKWDKDERGIPNVLVNINGNNLVSDQNGKITFKKLPRSTYPVSIYQHYRLYPFERAFNITLDESKTINIPMFIGGSISGKLNITRAKFSEIDNLRLNGVTITAAAANGEKFTVQTNAQGEFNFTLPLNNYTLFIDDETFKSYFIISNPNILVDIKDSNEQEFVFKLTEKGRNVNIKRF